MKIKKGDVVCVSDWGYMYDTCNPWFAKHKEKLSADWMIRYAYGDTENYEKRKYTDNNTYIVLYVDEEENKALISLYTAHAKVYLIGLDALYRVRKMTLKQIEEELGYRIKIVES